MKVGSTVRDKRTGQYFRTTESVANPSVGGPVVKVRPKSVLRTITVHTSDIEPVAKKDDPFRYTYVHWVLAVIQFLLVAMVVWVSFNVLRSHGINGWVAVGFALAVSFTANALTSVLFGLKR